MLKLCLDTSTIARRARRIFIVSLYIRALMPLEILSGGINPEAAYLAPFADSSDIVMSLMKI